jgi:hypothetical protein
MAVSSTTASNDLGWRDEMADTLFQLLQSKRAGSCEKRLVIAESAIELDVHATASQGLDVNITVLDDSCHICFGRYEIRIERAYTPKDADLITKTALLLTKLMSSRVRLRRYRTFGIFDTYVIEVEEDTGWKRVYTGSTPALRVPTETIVLENWF